MSGAGMVSTSIRPRKGFLAWKKVVNQVDSADRRLRRRGGLGVAHSFVSSSNTSGVSYRTIEAPSGIGPTRLRKTGWPRRSRSVLQSSVPIWRWVRRRGSGESKSCISSSPFWDRVTTRQVRFDISSSLVGSFSGTLGKSSKQLMLVSTRPRAAFSAGRAVPPQPIRRSPRGSHGRFYRQSRDSRHTRNPPTFPSIPHGLHASTGSKDLEPLR